MFKKIETEWQAFEIVGITPDIEKFKLIGLPEDRIQPLFDSVVVELLCEANNIINDNWKPDWSDPNQGKYFTGHWVEKDESKPAGFGLTGTYCDSWLTRTYVGERLLVGSAEQAIYLGEQFKSRFESARLVLNR